MDSRRSALARDEERSAPRFRVDMTAEEAEEIFSGPFECFGPDELDARYEAYLAAQK